MSIWQVLKNDADLLLLYLSGFLFLSMNINMSCLFNCLHHHWKYLIRYEEKRIVFEKFHHKEKKTKIKEFSKDMFEHDSWLDIK